MQILLYCLVLPYIKTIKRLHIKNCDACPFAKSQRVCWGAGQKFSALTFRDRAVCLPRRGKRCACLHCFNSQKSLRHEVPTGDYSYAAACVLSAITRPVESWVEAHLSGAFSGWGCKAGRPYDRRVLQACTFSYPTLICLLFSAEVAGRLHTLSS